MFLYSCRIVRREEQKWRVRAGKLLQRNNTFFLFCPGTGWGWGSSLRSLQLKLLIRYNYYKWA